SSYWPIRLLSAAVPRDDPPSPIVGGGVVCMRHRKIVKNVGEAARAPSRILRRPDLTTSRRAHRTAATRERTGGTRTRAVREVDQVEMDERSRVAARTAIGNRLTGGSRARATLATQLWRSRWAWSWETPRSSMRRSMDMQ